MTGKEKSTTSSKGFIALIITQFLGAFNDNAFKIVISLYIISMGIGMQAGSEKVSIAAAVFVVPFIIFSAFAGRVSDRYSKKSVIVYTKVVEVLVMLFGMAALLTGNLTVIFFALFLMGSQSAFFSPSKYGILPEMIKDEQLSNANGILQMFTFLAIILGTAAGGGLFTIFEQRVYLSSIVFVAVAALGVASSLYVEKVRPAKSDKKLEPNPFKSVYETYLKVKDDRPLFFTIIAIAFFWFVGALFQLNILIYGSEMMHLSQGKIAALMTIIAFGIGTGSALAGRLSGDKVEFGLVPIGSMGMVIFSYVLYFSYTSFLQTTAALLLLGIASGFFIIPFTAYLQQESAVADKGENVAFSNIISFTGILFASGYLYFMSNILEIDPAGIFLTMSIAVLVVSLLLLKAMSESFTRFVLWTLTHTVYKATVIGKDFVPKTGPALIVCNYPSHAAPFLIESIFQRHVTLLVPRRYYKRKWKRWLLRRMNVIMVPEKHDSRAFAKAMELARRELNDRNLVCVFPEDTIVKTGSLQKFHEEFIKIARECRVEVPVIPAYISSPAACLFGFKKFLTTRSHTVLFGEGVPADIGAYEARQAVSLLSSKAFEIKKREDQLLHLCFISTAKKRFFKKYMSDSLGFSLIFGEALAAVLVFTDKLSDSLKKNEKMVGIMMPTSCIANLLNLSVLMAGSIPVNLNYTASDDSIASAVKQCKIKTIFTSAKLLEKLNITKTNQMVFVEKFFKDIELKDKLIGILKAFFKPTYFLKKEYDYKLRPDDIATIIFSSGSTGDPKGVMLTHSNIISNIEAVRQILPLKIGDTFCGILPFFHSFGFTVTLMMPALCGFEVTYHPNPVDAATIGKICHKNRCTLLMATPTFLSSYIKKCEKDHFKHLKYVIVGAEKLKKSVDEAFYEKYGHYPLEGYGTTELSPAVSLNVPDIMSEGTLQIGTKKGSIGRTLPGVSVKAVDIDTGEELGLGEEGLLLVKGPNVMKGYLNNPKLTAEVIKDGWYNTGDIAKVDEDGFITITDRLSRFSKIGGEMVPHIKVEGAILDIVQKEGLVCAVTSVPDSKKGERLVVLHTDLGMDVDELWNKLNAMDLPKLWIPRKDSFSRVDEIPILGTGKISLKKIKEIACDKYGSL